MRGVLSERLTPIHRQFLADTVEQRFNFNRAVEMAKTAQTPEEFAAWNQARNQANEAFLAAAKDTHAQRSALLKELAADPNNSGLRIHLTLGGEGEGLGIKLTAHEQVIHDRMQEFYSLWKNAADEVGLKTLSGPYARRLYDHDGQYTGARGTLNDFSSKTIGEKEFQARMDGSVDWFPDLQDTAQNYILTAAKRVGWRQWENRWADTLNASPNHIRDYATTLYNDWQGQSSQGVVSKACEVYRQAESLRLIAYNLGTVVKHAFKLPQTIAHVGFSDTIEALGPLFNAYRGNDPTTKRLIDSFAQFKALSQIAFEDVAPTFNNPSSEKLLGFYNKMRQWGTSGIAAMEYFENGLSIVGSALKAARGENFDFQLWRQGMWDTINRCNYRSDIDTPHWMRTGAGRVASLFTFTPLKITTGFAQTAAEGGKDLLNVLKGASRHQTELGENWFTVAVRMATMYGLAEAGARATGHTLLPQFLHVPYLRELKEAWQGGPKIDPSLNMPPAIQWAASMKDVGIVHGTLNHWSRDWALWKNAKPLFAPNDFNKQKYDNTGMAILGIQKEHGAPGQSTNPWK
jgi:curved DNA-binding protein CbpA